MSDYDLCIVESGRGVLFFYFLERSIICAVWGPAESDGDLVLSGTCAFGDFVRVRDQLGPFQPDRLVSVRLYLGRRVLSASAAH